LSLLEYVESFDHKAFALIETFYFGVIALDVKLVVDGEKIDTNEFVAKILGGTIVGAVTSLRDIKKNWKNIEIKITK
jgi:hypothetical protein